MSFWSKNNVWINNFQEKLKNEKTENLKTSAETKVNLTNCQQKIDKKTFLAKKIVRNESFWTICG